MADQGTTDEATDATANAEATDTETEIDWKAYARKHEREAKKAARELAETRAQLEQSADAAKSETDKAIDAARREAAQAARNEVVTEFRKDILSEAILAQATGKFSNPALAERLLDLDITEAFTEDGKVDRKVIASQIDEFLELDENAGLRAGAVPNGKAAGDADAGRGAGSAKASPEQQHHNFLAAVLRGEQPV